MAERARAIVVEVNAAARGALMTSLREAGFAVDDVSKLGLPRLAGCRLIGAGRRPGRGGRIDFAPDEV